MANWKSNIAPHFRQNGLNGSGGGGSGLGSASNKARSLRRMMISLLISFRARAQLWLMNPKWRTFMKPLGRTCSRKRLMNSMTSSVIFRCRRLPTLR